MAAGEMEIAPDTAEIVETTVEPAMPEPGMLTRAFMASGLKSIFPGPDRVRSLAIMGCTALAVASVSSRLDLDVPKAVSHLSVFSLSEAFDRADDAVQDAYGDRMYDFRRDVERVTDELGDRLHRFNMDVVEAVDDAVGPSADALEKGFNRVVAGIGRRLSAASEAITEFIDGEETTATLPPVVIPSVKDPQGPRATYASLREADEAAASAKRAQAASKAVRRAERGLKSPKVVVSPKRRPAEEAERGYRGPGMGR